MHRAYFCVECGAPVAHLYQEYGKGNIVLTKCSECGMVADRYIEYDLMFIFLSMLLQKPQVYRHIIYNRNTAYESNADVKGSPISPKNHLPPLHLNRPRRRHWRKGSLGEAADTGSGNGTGSPAPEAPIVTKNTKQSRFMDQFALPLEVGKLGILLVLFDVYTKWSRMEVCGCEDSGTLFQTVFTFLPRYLYFSVACAAEWVLYYLVIRIVSRFVVGKVVREAARHPETQNEQEERDRNQQEMQQSQSHDPNSYLLLALIVSSFGKLLNIVMVIWDYQGTECSWILEPFVFISNAEALAVVYRTNYLRAYTLTAIGVGFKYLLQRILYRIVDPTRLF